MDWRRTTLRAGAMAAVACLLLLSGCAGLGPRRQPEVSLANLQVREIRALETVFLVELRILNPDEKPLSLQGIDCELRVDGRHFANGLSGERYEIPPYGSIIVPLPAYASMLDLVAQVIARLQQTSAQTGATEPLRYELTGHVRMSSGAGGNAGTLPFATKGELALPGGH